MLGEEYHKVYELNVEEEGKNGKGKARKGGDGKGEGMGKSGR